MSERSCLAHRSQWRHQCKFNKQQISPVLVRLGCKFSPWYIFLVFFIHELDNIHIEMFDTVLWSIELLRNAMHCQIFFIFQFGINCTIQAGYWFGNDSVFIFRLSNSGTLAVVMINLSPNFQLPYSNFVHAFPYLKILWIRTPSLTNHNQYWAEGKDTTQHVMDSVKVKVWTKVWTTVQ